MAVKVRIIRICRSDHTCQDILNLRFWQHIKSTHITNTFNMKFRIEHERLADIKMGLQAVQQFFILIHLSSYCFRLNMKGYPHIGLFFFHQGKNQIVSVCFRSIKLTVQTLEVVLNKLVIHSFSWLDCSERI